MAQHDYNIANQSGADFRSDLNNALSAIASTNSGDTSPTTTFANQLWIDTANNVLKIRNEGNSAWITTGISIAADNTFNIDGGTVNGITALSFSSGSSVTTILDEDNLGSNSATALATQQSIKAYVDSQVGSVDTLAEILTNGNTTGGTDISLSSSDITGTGNINITGTIQSSGAITGNLTGNVTGNASTATALQTARTINGASFDGTANISFNTDSVSEGSSNLYFTNARVESYLDAGSATPTFASAVINSSLTGSAILDDDTFGTASATTVATSESIKAYVDAQVATADSLAEVLANGNTTGGSNILFGDNDKAIFGAGSDLSIYHDVSNSYIKDNGTGNLNIQSNGVGVVIAHTDGTDLAVFNSGNGTANLYHSGSLKIATTSSGIDVTGTVVSDGLTVDGNINLGDNDSIYLGDSNDLRIYHDSGSSLIRNTTGSLYIQDDDGHVYIRPKSGQDGLIAIADGAVTLHHSGNAKLATTSTGIDVTGNVTIPTGNKIAFDTDGLTYITEDQDERLRVWVAATEFIRMTNTTTDEIRLLPYGGNLFAGGNLDVTGTVVSDKANIGTSTAQYSGTDLTVGDNSDSQNGLAIQTSTSGIGYILFGDGSGASAYRGEINYSHSTDSMTLKTAGTTRLNLANNGDISFYEDTGSTQALFWDASAEALGIGTTSIRSNYSLDVRNAGNSGVNIQAGDEAADIVLSVGSAGTPDKFVITSGGSVGISTDSPEAKLHVKDNTTVIGNGSSGYATINFHSATTSSARYGSIRKNYDSPYDMRIRGSNSTDSVPLIFETASNAEAMRVDSSQNLLVGTTASVVTTPAKLEILGGTGGGRCINTKATVDTSANHITFHNGNGQVGYINTNGTTTAYNTSSDARLKDITGSARGLEVINELNPVSYNWKADGKADEGLIAQEVQEIVPNAVSGSEEEHYQMDYSKLVVHLVKGMKEQQTQIEALQSEINLLKGE